MAAIISQAMEADVSPVALRLHFPCEPTGICFHAGLQVTSTILEEGSFRDGVKQALWEAADRLARPEGWASMPDSLSPVLHTDPTGSYGFNAPFEHSIPPPSRPARPDLQDDSPSYTKHPHFKRASLDILPDIPGGLESVDQLAVHIPICFGEPTECSRRRAAELC